MSQPQSVPPAGQRFGRYEVLERLGRGGMAEVFKARLRGPHGVEKLVALKRILPDALRDPKFVQLFVREARLSTRLQHPNLIQVFELGQEQGELYLAMELVEGCDLRRVLTAQAALGKRMPPEIALCIVHGVLLGLEHAHRLTDGAGQRLNVVHRDLSPANVLLSYAGAVKVADFGVAHVDGPEKSDANLLKGKLSYMAPEQLKGQAVDARVDVFAAACVLYEMLAGEPVYGGKVTPSLVRKVARGEVPQVRQALPGVDPALAEVLQRALAPERSQRTPSCERFDAELMELVHTGRLRCAREAELALYLQVLLPPAQPEPPAAEAPQTLQSRAPPPSPLANLFDSSELDLPLEPPGPLDQDSIVAVLPGELVEQASEPVLELDSGDIVGPAQEPSSLSRLFAIPLSSPKPARAAPVMRFTPAALPELGHAAVLPAWEVVERAAPPRSARPRRTLRALLAVALVASLALLAARWRDLVALARPALPPASAMAAAPAPAPAPTSPGALLAPTLGLHLETPHLQLALPALTLPVSAAPARKSKRPARRRSASALAADAAFQR